MIDYKGRLEFMLEALRQTLGRDPWASERDACMGIGILETGLSSFWKTSPNPWNFGAIQATKAWRAAGGKEFGYTDTHPNADGTSTPYKIGFRIYDGPLEGCMGLAALLQKMTAIGDGGVSHGSRTSAAVSQQLYNCGYYEGFGKTPAERVEHHRSALAKSVAQYCKALGIPQAIDAKSDYVCQAPAPVASTPGAILLDAHSLAGLGAASLLAGLDRKGGRETEIAARQALEEVGQETEVLPAWWHRFPYWVRGS